MSPIPLLAILFALWSPFVWAGSALSGHPATVELVSDVEAVAAGQPFEVALHFRIQPHWHIYWKNPGDSGIPPSVKWDLPPQVNVGDIHWPTPERIETPPLVSYGYSNEVYLLMPVTFPTTWKEGVALPLKGHVDWLVCQEICIPARADVALNVLVKDGGSPFNSKQSAFQRTKASWPKESLPFSVRASTSGSQLFFHIDHSFATLSKALFFPERLGDLQNAGDQEWLVDKTEARLSLAVDTQSQQKLSQIKGVLVFFSENSKSEEAYEVDLPVDRNPSTTSAANPGATTMTAVHPTLWQMIAFAFLGGLILNLMPCVFPILSIKILGFVEQAGKSKHHLRNHGWAFFAGVLASFWVLAGALLLLRAGGEKLGWGFQLQSPLFLFSLITLLFFMALSFLGVFEFGQSFGGVGGSLASKSGYSGSFFSGVLATIVATPCTAPFMGSAVGFALTEPPTSALLIFTSLGAGMAFPYLALSYFPQLLRFLPRPGRWMETLKQFMGFPLLATVIWLVWVFSFQVGMDGVLRLMMGLLLFSIAAWIYGRTKPGDKRIWFPRTATGVALVLGLYLGVAGTRQTPMERVTTAQSDGMAWEPYSPTRLKELHAKGTPVFLDFTAAWCVSCQVNEKVVFSSSEVRRRFQELGIVGMKADWTNGDEQITEMLASFGRSGVPFYLLYDKNPNAQPKPLPEVLSPGIVLDALKSL